MKREGSLDGRYVCEIGIAIAVERLLRAGFAVAVPLIDDGYDLLAFDARRYWRIQVKATSQEGREGHRVRIRCGKNKRGSYCPAHVDAFVGVHVTRRKVVCVPSSDCDGKSHLYFRRRDGEADFGVLRRIKTQRC